jgi:hypothetical protein
MVNNYPKSIKFTTLRIALLVALSSIFGISLAQTVMEVPLGNPSGGTRRQPLGAFFGFERSIMVYDKTEMNGGAGLPAGSSITRLEFFYETNDGCPIGLDYNVKVYLKEVSAASLTTSDFNSNLPGSQLAFDGTMVTSNWTTTGVWIAIDLQNCFIFQNNNNSIEVLVETNFGSPPANDLNGWFAQASAPCAPQTSNAILFRGSSTTNSNFMTWAQDQSPPTFTTTPSTFLRPNIRITYSPAVNCNLLAPMSAQANASSVCSGTSFTVTLPTLPCVAGLTFQWQSSIISAAAGFGNIAGATNAALTTTQSQQTWYRCVIGCTFSATFMNSGAAFVAQNSYLGCYCAMNPIFNGDTDIGNVTMTRTSNGAVVINNPPGGCSPVVSNPNAVNTYTDYTGLGPYTMVQGENYGMSLCQITQTNTFFPAFFNVFIDWNADGVFDLTNERVLTGGQTSQATPTVSGTILVPFSSDTGITRMRVGLRENGSAADDACGVFFGWGETEDYNVNIIPGLICNLTTPGNAVSSFPSVCTNQLFTLSITGNATVGSFQTWQWQASTNGGVSWGNITGATFSPYTTSQTVNTCYRCVLTCNGGSSQFTSMVCVPMASPTQCYCIPPHPPGCGTNSISNVVFNTLSNPTGCTSGNADSYTQYPVSGSTTTSITQGNTYNLTISTAGGNAIISVWIDWNRNGIFESSEHYQPSTNNPAGAAPTVPVLVPTTSGTGLTGMRVRSRAAGSPNGPGDACTAFFSGEAEDYFITIIPFVPPNCSGVQPVVGVTTTQSAPCSGTNFTLTLNTALLSGMQYQWQANTGGGYTNIVGATGISYTGSQTQTTTYQIQYQCTLPSASGWVTSSPPLLVTNTANYWRGINSDWSDAQNWCSGTPRLSDDVLISRTQPGVANPYYTPIVAVSDTLLSNNLTIALNDSITLYNDTLNSVNIGQTLTVNGKFIMRSSVSDTCCTELFSGTSSNTSFQPFRTNVAENRLQIVYLQNDFASMPNLSTSDQVTYVKFTIGSAPIAAASGTFQNFKVSYGWLSPTTVEFGTTDPYPTPNTVATIASISLVGKIAGDTLMIPVSNFKWRTDSNLVLQFCYDTPTGQSPAGGAPTWQMRVKPTTPRRSVLFASITNSSLNGGNDGCALLPTTPGVSTQFGEFRPNLQLIFGRKPKKLTIPIGNDLLVNSTGAFYSALANLTVADSLNNQGLFNIDTTAVTVTTLLLNSGTFDMSYPYGGTNEFSSLTVGGQGMTNNGTFTAGKSPITVTGTTFDNASGTFNAGTNLFTMSGVNFNNSATYNAGTSTLVMNSAATQTIGGTSPLSLYRLRLAKNLNSTLVTLNNTAVSVTDSIDLVKGSIDLNGKTLTFTNPAVLTFRPVVASNGYIINSLSDFSGKIKWTIGTNTGNHIFPFYRLPLASPEVNAYVPIEFTNVAGVADNVGDVTTSTYYTTGVANTPLPPNVWHIHNSLGVSNAANMTNRYWYVERSGALGAPNTTLAFTLLNSAPYPEKKATQTLANIRMQPYYTYTVASPPPLTRAAWLSPPGVQSATQSPALGNPFFRTQVASYNWSVAGLASPWASATNITPLPIELLQFDATLSGSQTDPVVDINWATASEEQNDYFTIERTLDFNYVTEIDRVPSQGSSSMIQKYYTVDNDPVMGKVNYYRLKQTDINGSTSFNDKWVAVNVGLKEVFNINYVKNMTKLEVVFEYDNNSKVDVVITDMTGREMYSSAGFGATPGLNLLPIDAEGWANGAYIITLKDNERQVSHKIFY